VSDPVEIAGILRREFEQMSWVDPRQVLVNLRWLELNLPERMDERVRRLRTNQLKEWREAREAALFAFGISDQVLRRPVLVTKTQNRDFDFVVRWHSDNADHYFPAQLKELPPDDVNADVTLEDLFDKLAKYSGTTDLSVVISINRRSRFSFDPWARPDKPRIKELWYMGCESPDQSRWFIYGSVLERSARKYEFSYPEGEPNVA
jgi:hypothetical protein